MATAQHVNQELICLVPQGHLNGKTEEPSLALYLKIPTVPKTSIPSYIIVHERATEQGLVKKIHATFLIRFDNLTIKVTIIMLPIIYSLYNIVHYLKYL